MFLMAPTSVESCRAGTCNWKSNVWWTTGEFHPGFDNSTQNAATTRVTTADPSLCTSTFLFIKCSENLKTFGLQLPPLQLSNGTLVAQADNTRGGGGEKPADDAAVIRHPLNQAVNLGSSHKASVSELDYSRRSSTVKFSVHRR